MDSTLLQALAIASFVALALVLYGLIRRLGKFANATREVDAFRRRVADLDARIGQSIDGVAARIDLLRRQTIEPGDIGGNLEAATDAVRRYAEEARTMGAPHSGEPIRAAIVAELERADRALELIGHGSDVLADARRGSREVEGQTSIKRGYLNLLHAREAIGRQAALAAQLRDPEAFIRLDGAR